MVAVLTGKVFFELFDSIQFFCRQSRKVDFVSVHCRTPFYNRLTINFANYRIYMPESTSGRCSLEHCGFYV